MACMAGGIYFGHALDLHAWKHEGGFFISMDIIGN
jgi:hypothetical protein